MAACAIALTSCHNHTDHEHEHDHDHDHGHEHSEAAAHSHDEHDHDHDHEGEEGHAHEKMLIVGYSDSYELFGKATPLAVGEEAEIEVYITDLADFKPVEHAEAKAIFNVGSPVSVEKHIHDGEIHFHVTPATAGEGTLTIELNGKSISAPVTVYPDHEEADEAIEEAEVHSSNGVAFTKEKIAKVDFATEACRTEPFGQVIRSSAQVLPSQARQQLIIAKTSGIVGVASGNVLPGSKVRAGQALYTISSKGLADSNIDVRYNEAKAEYERAKGNYERMGKLTDSKVASQAEYSEAEAAYLSAKAEYDNISANYRNGSFSASSDIDGYITEIFATNGQYVEAGQALASVSSDSRVLLQARVQPRYRRNLENATDAVFVTEDGNFSLKQLDGRIVSVARAASEGSPVLPVTFEVANRGLFVPGTFVDVYIKTRSSAEAITVANEALVEEMGNFFVYKQLTPEFFEKTQVSVGTTDGVRTEIKSGLQAGDRVVSRGAILVKLAQAAGGLDAHAGHVH